MLRSVPRCQSQNRPLYTTRSFKRSHTVKKEDDLNVSLINLSFETTQRRKSTILTSSKNHNKENLKDKRKKQSKAYIEKTNGEQSNLKDQSFQTEPYLEEIVDKPIISNKICQTDLFFERPITPIFVPVKSGVDVATEIQEGDLFDFETEVKPIIQNLVTKIMSQSLVEVVQEDEISDIKAKQKKFIEIREVEEAEMKRLEDREQRFYEEKEQRKNEYEETIRMASEAQKSLKNALFTQKYFANLLPNLVTDSKQLEMTKEESISKDVENDFIPWLMRGVHSQIDGAIMARDIVSQMIYDVVQNQNYMYNPKMYRAPEQEREGEDEANLSENTNIEYIEEEREKNY